MYVYLNSNIVTEIIPAIDPVFPGIPITARYSPEFLAQCVHWQEGVAQGWLYDPETNTWTQKAGFKGGILSGAFGFSIESKGYIGTIYRNFNSNSYNTVFLEYDPETNTWTQRTDFPCSGRFNAVGFSIGNKGYVGTGNSNGDLFQDFWEYNPATDVWSQKADFPGKSRELAIGFSIGTKGYIGLGCDKRRNLYKDFWEYNPVSNKWTKKTNLEKRSRLVGFSIGNKGYVGTGAGKDNTNCFWEFTP